MSRQTARLALDQFCGKPSLVAPIYAGQSTNIDEIVSSGMLADLRELSVANPKKEEARWQQRKQTMAAAYGFEYVSQAETKPFAFANGKAIIPIHGILINRFPHSWSFVTGYNFIRSQVEAAEDDPDVDGVIEPPLRQDGRRDLRRLSRDFRYHRGDDEAYSRRDRR